jgi:hypothetical protein
MNHPLVERTTMGTVRYAARSHKRIVKALTLLVGAHKEGEGLTTDYGLCFSSDATEQESDGIQHRQDRRRFALKTKEPEIQFMYWFRARSVWTCWMRSGLIVLGKKAGITGVSAVNSWSRDNIFPAAPSQA